MTSITRRSVLFGGLCVASFATAEMARPRTPLRFPPETTLGDAVPAEFGDWRSQYDPNLIVPPTEDSLTDRLYDDLLMRRYRYEVSGEEVFLLAAYGASQTDELQLHRPESCYPAVGLPITSRSPFRLRLAARDIPAVALASSMPGRIEDIIYWSRIGGQFPRTASEQRSAKLDLALKGLIPDGILVRVSTIRRTETETAANLPNFLNQMLRSMSANAQAVLIAA